MTSITDFVSGEDKIALVGFFDHYEQFLLAQAGNSDPNVIVLGDGSSITLNVPIALAAGERLHSLTADPCEPDRRRH